MFEERYCDICDRSESEIFSQATNGTPKLERDPDGLWVCSDCKPMLRTKPVKDEEDEDEDELEDEVRSLVGRSAGAISSVLGLPYEPPFRAIIDAAMKIAYDEDRFMSSWSFVTRWLDGSTVWQAADSSERAIVTSDGAVMIQPR